MSPNFEKFKSSISFLILRNSLAIYLLIVLTLTSIQIVFEFKSIKSRILGEFENIKQARTKEISSALFNEDDDSLESILKNIITDRKVKRIILYEEGKKIRMKISSKKNKTHTERLFEKKFSYSFPLLDKEGGTTPKEIGSVLIITDDSIIYDELIPKIIFIFLNSILKTLALILILLMSLNKYISSPLNRIIDSIKNSKIDGVDPITIKKNEISELYHSILNLVESNDKIVEKLKIENSSYKNKSDEFESYGKTLEKEIQEKNKILTKAHSSAKNSIKMIEELKSLPQGNKQSPSNEKIDKSFKHSFLSKVSHEFRTPLNAILGFTDIMMKKITDAQSSYYLESISSSGKKLLTLINDILDLSNAEAQSIKLNYGPISAHSLFKKLNQEFTKTINKKNNNLEFFISSSFPQTIFLDESRLHQILGSIIENANNFTNSGKIKVSCGLSDDDIDKRDESINLHFSIQDNGVGIPLDEQKNIFEAFKQGNKNNNVHQGGAGLGLTLSKNLCELMGGNITLESQENEGSTFTLNFKNVKISSKKLAEKLKSKVSQLYNFKNSTILIAENDPLNKKILTNFLEGHNFLIKFCSDGRELIEQAKILNSDLILIERSLPLINGIKVAEELKQYRSLSHIPLILLTSSPDIKENPLVDKFFDDIILKPIQENGLILKLTKFLNYETKPSESIENTQDMTFSLSNASTASLKEVLQKLNSPEWQEKYENMVDTLTINEIEIFAKDLIGLGEECKTKEVILIGEKLLFEATNFDMDGISTTLKAFEKLKVELEKALK